MLCIRSTDCCILVHVINCLNLSPERLLACACIMALYVVILLTVHSHIGV